MCTSRDEIPIKNEKTIWPNRFSSQKKFKSDQVCFCIAQLGLVLAHRFHEKWSSQVEEKYVDNVLWKTSYAEVQNWFDSEVGSWIHRLRRWTSSNPFNYRGLQYRSFYVDEGIPFQRNPKMFWSNSQGVCEVASRLIDLCREDFQPWCQTSSFQHEMG